MQILSASLLVHVKPVMHFYWINHNLKMYLCMQNVQIVVLFLKNSSLLCQMHFLTLFTYSHKIEDTPYINQYHVSLVQLASESPATDPEDGCMANFLSFPPQPISFFPLMALHLSCASKRLMLACKKSKMNLIYLEANLAWYNIQSQPLVQLDLTHHPSCYWKLISWSTSSSPKQ